MVAIVAETGQIDERDNLNKRVKQNTSKWRDDPDPDRLSHGGRRREAADRTEFSVAGSHTRNEW